MENLNFFKVFRIFMCKIFLIEDAHNFAYKQEVCIFKKRSRFRSEIAENWAKALKKYQVLVFLFEHDH